MTKLPPPSRKPPRQRRRASSVADLRVDTSSPTEIASLASARSNATDKRDARVSATQRMSAPIAMHLRVRGVFLLVMAFVAFAAFVLFVLSEMTHHHRQHLEQQRFVNRDHNVDTSVDRIESWPLLLFTPAMQRDIHTASVWVLALAVPITSAAAWFPVSITHSTDGVVVRIRSPVAPPTSPTTAAILQRLPLLQRLATQLQTNHYFRAYQIVSWSLYATFLVLALGCANATTTSSELPLAPATAAPMQWSLHTVTPAALLRLAPFCNLDHRSNVAVVAFMAEVLMVSSILALERGRDQRRRLATASTSPDVAPHARETRIVLILNHFNNSLLLVGALLLAIASEYTRQLVNSGASDAYSLSSGVGSLALFVTAMLNTYGLGGRLARKRGWRFYQPFMGGCQFVVFQIISWTCFGAGVLVQGLYLLSLVLVEMELFVGAMAVAGSLFAVSQVVMMMSVLVFRSPAPLATTTATAVITSSDSNVIIAEAAPVLPASTVPQTFQTRLQDFADECLGALVVSILVNLQWIPSAFFFVFYAATTRLSAAGVVTYSLATIVAEIFFVLARSIATHMYSKDSLSGTKTHVDPNSVKYQVLPALSLLLPSAATFYHYYYALDALAPIAALTLFLCGYSFTYSGAPQHSGVRTNRALMTKRHAAIEAVAAYFRGRIIREAPLDPTQHYVIAFHPHGIMATTCMWLSFTQQWRTLFPGVHPHLLTASVLHQIPLVRDVMQLMGSLEVTRQAFTAALAAKQSVMLVPGGQAEMLEQHAYRKQVRVLTKHKGFLRVALEHGTPLVPVLSFKEGELMDNVKAPLLQRWFVKHLAFPFPYFPYGRGFLPVPRRVDATVVVGAPIPVPQTTNPTVADVDKIHAIYFTEIERLFHAHKDAAGCSDYTLVLL